MSDVVLPREIAYSPSLPALPECTNTEIVAAPVNGASFGPGQLIQFDLISKGMLDPSSVYLRYKYTLTNGVGERSGIRGTPVYSFFQKCETIIGSSVVESQNDYNQICNMYTNLQMDIGMKYGNATAYGWLNSEAAGGVVDGRYCVNNETVSLAAPLPCLLTMAEKLVPLGMMPSVRIQLTTESIANMFIASITNDGVTYKLPTAYSLTNVELCYNIIDFNYGVYDIVQNMGDKFYIKSTSWQSMSQYVPSGSTGTNDLVYNCRLASIKSLFVHFCGGTSSRAVSGKMESVDITNGGGELVFTIAGIQYPSRPVSTLNCKSAVIMELKKAVGALHKEGYNFSINADEFSYKDSDLGTLAAPTPTTLAKCGKFWFGVNTEKLSSSNVLLSGVSTQSSPITLRLGLSSTALVDGYNVTLNAMYDCLLEIDPHNKQCTVKQ
jgi:hypothetical protein